MILVCGDAMIDRYWFGEVERISPEAPVPVHRITRSEERDGGAANVANNIESLGIPVKRSFSKSYERVKKTRIIARGQHLLRADEDPPQEPITEIEPQPIVVFVDYGKGALDQVDALIQMVKGSVILVDPKGHDYRKYSGADLVKPNASELKEVVGGWSTEDELADKAYRLLREANIGGILLTRAAGGMTLFTTEETIHEPAHNSHPVDVSGAGEAALSAYAVSLAKGFKPYDCVRLASKAAAIACSRQGTVVCTAEEIFGTG